MAGEKVTKAALDLTTGVLSQDIGKVVGTLVSLGLTVRNNKLKCEELIGHAKNAAGTIQRFERDKELKAEFNEEDYRHSLEKFKIVVEDCTACVKRYRTTASYVRALLSLKFEDDFDSLHGRLDNAVKWFDLDLQVHNTALLHHNRSEVEAMKAEVETMKVLMQDKLGELKALMEGRMAPDITHELSTRVKTGESLVEGYILAGRLDDRFDVMLVATENEKKEASILLRLSNHDNILRFYGTFLVDHRHNYLVMERPQQQQLQTVYDWNREGHGDEWRLKNMMALEIALGLAFAHKAGILHKNLRSANVFLTDDGHPKIFGFFKGRVKSEISDKKWTDAEQLRWTAPEMLDKKRPRNDEKCDIFSLGVIIWELVTGDSPFSEFSGIAQLLSGRKKNPRARLHIQESNVPFLVAFQQVSLDCMEDDPEQRPTIDNVVSRLEVLAPEDMCISFGGGPV